jgi:hypothetical protein
MEDVIIFKEFIILNFLELKPFGIADLTTPTALDAVPHSFL